MTTATEEIEQSAKVETDRNSLYPIFLKLEEMRLLIVGGGNVALEKLSSVLNNSPLTHIKIIAPKICEEIKNIAAANPFINFVERKIGPFDLDYAQIIIVAVDDRAVSDWVYAQAKAKGKLVNVADTPEHCDFYLGSIVNKGHLKIAISTNGKSPTIAKRFRELFHEAIPNIDGLLHNMHLIRKKLSGHLPEKIKKLNELTASLVQSDNPSIS